MDDNAASDIWKTHFGRQPDGIHWRSPPKLRSLSSNPAAVGDQKSFLIVRAMIGPAHQSVPESNEKTNVVRCLVSEAKRLARMTDDEALENKSSAKQT